VTGLYVDGVSIWTITPPGNTEEHIWTYVAAWSEDDASEKSLCPCRSMPGPDGGSTAREPQAFVGTDYYCESANQGAGNPDQTYWHTADPLWDEGCDAPGGVPWFEKTLSRTTSNPIHVDILLDQGPANENVSVSEIVILVR
jgi:hypothetical protein